jgi:LysR family transcriptional activator of nhaA
VYSYYLGECGVVWMAPPRLAKLYRKGFPKSLKGAPVVLPTDDTAIRRKFDQWFAGLGIEPKVIGEFEDFALLRVFGQAGAGILPVTTTLEKQDKVIRLGIARNVFGCF